MLTRLVEIKVSQTFRDTFFLSAKKCILSNRLLKPGYYPWSTYIHGEESLQPKKAKFLLRGKKHASSTVIRMRLAGDIYRYDRQL